MAAILQLRKGTNSDLSSIGNLSIGELFYNTDREVLQVGTGTSNITLSRLGVNTGSIEFTGDITLGGSIFLGDANTDNIIIQGELSSSIIPDSGSTYDLGSATKQWRNVHAINGLFGNGIISGSSQIVAALPDGLVSGSSQITFANISSIPSGIISSSEQLPAGVVSGSIQVLGGTDIISGSEQITDFGFISSSDSTTSLNSYTASNDINITNLHSFTSSNENTSLNTFTASNANTSLNTFTSSNENTSLNTFTASNANTSLNSYTASNDTTNSGQDTRINQLAAATGSYLTSISDSFLNTSLNEYTSSNDINISNIHSTTSSFESRLDFLSNVSHSHANKANLDTINQNLSTTSDVTFNTGSFTGNMTITGNLTVLGSATEISSTELKIEDKLITVASGSADSAAADGAGLEIDGANKSLKWDHNTSQFVFDAKVSSSVGFKGEGGELTGIDTDQVTEGSNLYYTNARVKQKMTDEVAHSGSFLGTATTSNLSEGSNLYFTEARFSSSLDSRNVVSGSSQVLDILDSLNAATGSYLTSVPAQHQNTSLNSFTASNANDSLNSFTASNANTSLNAATSSYLTTVDISSDTNLAVSDTSEVNMILTGDTLSAELIGGVVSGSGQLNNVFLSKLGDSVVSSSTFSSPSQGTLRATINGANSDVNIGLSTDATASFARLNLTALQTSSDSTLTALFVDSNQVKFNSLGTAALLHYSNSIADGNSQVIGTAQATKNYIDAQIIEAGAGDITEVNAGLGLSGGALTGSATLTLDTASAHFTTAVAGAGGGSTLSLNSYTASNDINITNLHAFTSSNANTSLNTFTASNANTSLNSYTQSATFRARVDDYLDGGNGIEYGSGTIDVDNTVVRTSIGYGFISGSSQVSYTGLSNIPAGIVSGSSQITGSDLDMNGNKVLFANVYSNEADLPSAVTYHGMFAHVHATGRGYFAHAGAWIPLVNLSDGVLSGSLQAQLPSGTVSGSSQIDHNATTNYTASRHIDHSAITVGSGQGLSGGGTIDTNRSITLDTGSNHFVEGVDNRLGSLNSYTASNDTTNSAQDTRLNQLSSATGSYLTTVDISSDTNLAVSDTSEVNMILTGDTISAELIGGVVSGSSQIDLSSATGVATSASFAETASLSTYTAEWILGASGASHYTFTGPGHLTGSSDPAIYLTRGQQYKFKNNAGSHPFRIQSTPNGSAGTQYNNGVTNNDAGNGTTLFFDVPMNAPETLYYQCTLHGNMGGPIYIVDSNSVDSRLDTLEGESHENPLTFNDTSTINLVRSTDTITAHAIGGVVSGSSQITLGGDATGSANDINVVAINGVTIDNAEATQIANINGSTISSTQWEYVGALNQQLATSNDVQFNDLVVSGDLTVQGTTVTLNTTNLEVEDKLLSVASGSTTPAQADGGGLHISGADASFTWDNGNSRIHINKNTFFSGSVQASGDIVAYASSDERLKNNIQPIEGAINKISQISGNSFHWNEEKQNIYKGKDYGVIAQEIESILPELVNTNQDGYKSVKYDKIIALLIEGIKELSAEINELKNK